MKTALLFVCASAWAVTAQASSFCTAGAGMWCEQPGGPDAGQTLSTAQYTVGSGSLNSIIGAINGLGGADLFAINIENPSAFAASYAPATGPNLNGGTITADSQAGLYLFNAAGMGLEAADEGSALTSFSGPAGIYYIEITGDGNVPEYYSGGMELAIFSPFVTGQIALPVSGAGPLSAYSGAGCGTACAGGYDISLTNTQYSGAPEPASLALTGCAISVLGLLFRRRRRSDPPATVVA